MYLRKWSGITLRRPVARDVDELAALTAERAESAGHTEDSAEESEDGRKREQDTNDDAGDGKSALGLHGAG